MTIVLDKPEQITMWVLLSRRAQVKMHMHGYPVKGLMSWLRRNIEGAENIRTVREGIVPLEYAIVAAGGPQDFTFINVHAMYNRGGMFIDAGIHENMGEIEAKPEMVQAYHNGELELVYTLDGPRVPNGQMYVPA